MARRELRPAVVMCVTGWLASNGGNPWFHDVRRAFPEVGPFELGVALRAYRKRHGLIHPAKIRRAQWRARDDVRLNAREDGKHFKDIAADEGCSTTTAFYKIKTAEKRNEAAARRKSAADEDNTLALPEYDQDAAIARVKRQLAALGIPQT